MNQNGSDKEYNGYKGSLNKDTKNSPESRKPTEQIPSERISGHTSLDNIVLTDVIDRLREKFYDNLEWDVRIAACQGTPVPYEVFVESFGKQDYLGNIDDGWLLETVEEAKEDLRRYREQKSQEEKDSQDIEIDVEIDVEITDEDIEQFMADKQSTDSAVSMASAFNQPILDPTRKTIDKQIKRESENTALYS